jgi:hypothetical protein
MFRSKRTVNYSSVAWVILIVLLSRPPYMASMVDMSQTDLGLVSALRYSSESEVASLPAPAFSLLSPFSPPEQRTPFKCVSLGAFRDWERNRNPWKSHLNLHYYNEAKGFVSISNYPTDPRPEEFKLSSADDIRIIRTFIADQVAGQSIKSSGQASHDLQQMANSLGVQLLGKLLTRSSVTEGTAETALNNAFAQERSQIVAGTKLTRTITPLATPDGRRFVRILTVVQTQGIFLPFQACYYSTPLPTPHVQYSEGLPVPAGGLDFVPSVVAVPLYVYVLDGGPSSTDVTKDVNAAVAIWEKAGVILTPKLEVLDKNRTVALLGKDESISAFFSCEQRLDNRHGEFDARIRLSKLKPNPNSLAIFFGKAENTQSEPDLLQAYIGNDPNKNTHGLTVAHEIGHLFFGSGHVGEETRGACDDFLTITTHPVAFTSRLMTSPPAGSDITYQDAVLARKKILTLPDARWW